MKSNLNVFFKGIIDVSPLMIPVVPFGLIFGVLAIEMGADCEDIALTMHPHPTLGETFAAASEVYTGTITDLYIPKKGER